MDRDRGWGAPLLTFASLCLLGEGGHTSLTLPPPACGGRGGTTKWWKGAVNAGEA